MAGWPDGWVAGWPGGRLPGCMSRMASGRGWPGGRGWPDGRVAGWPDGRVAGGCVIGCMAIPSQSLITAILAKRSFFGQE